MMRSRRHSILQSHGLVYAPAERQEAFWLCYNHRNRRAAVPLGEVALELLSEGLLRSSRRLGEVSRAWRKVVPGGYESLTQIEGFSGGRVRVTVDSAATKFVLSRQLGQTLVDRLNTCLGRRVVQRIEYRVGSLAAQA